MGHKENSDEQVSQSLILLRTKVPHLLYRKEITYTLQPRFCKVDYRSVNVQCPNSTQDNTILMMVLEAVM